MRRVYQYLLAFAFAILANYFFTGEWFARSNETHPDLWTWKQSLASLLLLIAIALSVWCFSTRDEFKRRQGAAVAWPERKPLLWIQFLPCCLLYLSSLAVYTSVGENAIVRLLWGASIAALFVPLFRYVELTDFWPLPLWEYGVLSVIVLAAFTVRYVDLTQVPLHIDNDVSIMGLFSKSLITGNDWSWVGMAPTDHQFSEHQFHALSMRLFGANHYGLAMSSVLAGTGSVIVLYFLGKILCNRSVGFIAAAFLSFNYVHIHFSRIVFGPLTTFFVLLASLFLLHGLRKASPFSFALGGVSLGMGMLGYYSGRVGPVIGGVIFLYWFFQRKKFAPVKFSYWLMALAGILLTFGPNLIYGLDNVSEFNGRGRNVILWTEGAWRHLSDKYQSHGDALIVLKEQIIRTFLAPFFFPDESTICYLRKPMLEATGAIFFILGLGFCLRRCTKIAFGYPLVWIGLTFVFGGVLTIDPPFWPHLNIAVPAIALVAAIGAERFCRRLILAGPGQMKIIIPTALAGILLISGVHSWDTYYRFAKDHAGGRIQAMRQIQKLPQGDRVFLTSRDVSWQAETFQFLTPEVEGSDLSEAELLKGIPPIEKPTTFIIFAETDPKCLELLKETFPWSTRQAYFDGWGWPAFTVVRILPQGYVEDMRRKKPTQVVWGLDGWRYLFALLIGLVAICGVAFRQEREGLLEAKPVQSNTLLT